jgi:hypothetical protein
LGITPTLSQELRMDFVIEVLPMPGVPEILAAIKVKATDFTWHLADVEASPWPQHIDDCWVSGSELIAAWVPGKTCFTRGVLNAFPLGHAVEVTELPHADGNQSFWTGLPLLPQLEGAVFEIVFWDSSAVPLIGINDEQAASLIARFPHAKRPNGTMMPRV